MITKDKENLQFRILYFIGIILIVANHAGNGSISLVYEWFPAYSFHIGLFVFASGYFFIKNRDVKTIDFIKKLVIKFLIPLFAWNLVYGLLIVFLSQFGYHLGNSFNFKTLFLTPLYNGHQFSFNLASWFLFPLFVIQLINIFIVKLINKKEKLYYVYFFISLLLGFLGVILAINGYYKGFYLLLVKVLYFLPFFSLGILYRLKLEKYDKLSNLLYFGILFLITLISIYAFGGIKKYTPALCNDFDNFYRPFLTGFLGIAFWLRVSKILVPSIGNSKFVKIISKNTFAIMMHQFLGFFLLNTLFYWVFKIFKIYNRFDEFLYKNKIYYFYLPKNLKQFYLLYVVAGIGVSLLISYGLRKLKNKIKSKYKIVKKTD